jgi:protein subunit release factor B
MGCHKLLLREEDSAVAPFQTALVSVEALPEEAPAYQHLLQRWEKEREEAEKAAKAGSEPPKKAEGLPEVIRVYAPDGDRFVRDLRTGVRTTQVREVLEGELDEFILAYLRTEEADAAWERE